MPSYRDEDDDEDGRGQPVPSDPIKDVAKVIAHIRSQGREALQIGLTPLMWLDFLDRLCPGARRLSDIKCVKYDGVPVFEVPYQVRNDKGVVVDMWEDGTVYFWHGERTPQDQAVAVLG